MSEQPGRTTPSAAGGTLRDVVRRTPSQRVVLLITGAIALVLLVGLVIAGRDSALRGLFPGGPECTVTARGRTVELTTRQAEVASRLVAPVVRRGGRVPAATRVLAAAMADNDLAAIEPPGSATPSKQQRQDARTLALTLTGRVRAGFSCEHGGASRRESESLDARGLTNRAAGVREDLIEILDAPWLGGYAAGGVDSGHMAGSAHYDGRAIDVMFRPITQENKRRGWALAQYLVANAERLAIDTVIYDAMIWTARRSDEGWRTYSLDTSGRSAATAKVLLHRDHVHVDVAR